jgi:hypothetical protein
VRTKRFHLVFLVVAGLECWAAYGSAQALDQANRSPKTPWFKSNAVLSGPCTPLDWDGETLRYKGRLHPQRLEKP